jgi:uncharacterized protein DUF4160
VFSEDLMPTISEFYGIMLRMYFMDHAPPHFHAIYGDSEAGSAFQRWISSKEVFRAGRCRSSSNGRRSIAMN